MEDHQRSVYRLTFQLTGSHEDAEDLAQEVFIKVHANLDGFRGESAMRSWIHRIAVNTYLNKRRKKSFSMMKFRSDLDDTAGPSQGERTDTAAQLSSVQKQVTWALEGLSPKERAAFALRHYNELSVKEVAEAMKVAEGTVKSLLFRAVQKLRKQLAFMKEE